MTKLVDPRFIVGGRTRVVTWEDPTAAVQTGKSISGIAYLKALQSGELPPPPIAVLMGMWITEVSEGRVVFAAEPAEYHYNPLGTVHGGVCSLVSLVYGIIFVPTCQVVYRRVSYTANRRRK